MIPKIKITDVGLKAPTTAEVINGGNEVLRSAFGRNINTDASTPQGQLNTSLSAEFLELNNDLIELFNQINPNFARGFMQDAIGMIYMMTRKKATYSVVQLTFKGLNGKVVPVDYIVQDLNGHKWITTESKIISNGVVLVNARAMTEGRIEASISTITELTQEIEGIDSVTNLTPAVVGFDEESREDFEARRKLSVYKNSWGMCQSVLGEVFEIKDVLDCVVVHNPTDKDIMFGVTNYPMPQHSLLCSAVGGDTYTIASKVIENGGTGCQFVGNTEVRYLDPSSNEYDPIYYDVKFLRPTHVNVFMTVVVDNIDAIGYEQDQFIKNNIIEAFRFGNIKACMNSRLIANRYMCKIAGIENNIIIDILVGRSEDEKLPYLDFGIDEFPVLDADNIKIEGL